MDKMVNFVDEEMDVNVPEEIQLPIFDSFFALENDINILEAQPTQINSQLLISYNTDASVNYDYCTSNIIIQSEKQNGFLNSSTTIQSNTTATIADGAQQVTVVSTSSPSSGRSY